MTRSSACSEPEVIRMFVDRAVDAGVGFELLDQEFAQAAGGLAGRRRRSRRWQACGLRAAAPNSPRRSRHRAGIVGIVVTAGEIVFRHAGEFGRRRRQAGAQQRREVEGVASWLMLARRQDSAQTRGTAPGRRAWAGRRARSTEAAHQLADRDLRLHPRQRIAGAGVDAEAERQMAVGMAADVAAVGIGNCSGSRLAAPMHRCT